MIQVTNLHKQFKMPVRKTGSFALLRNLFALEYDYKVAVENISFTVDKGEMVGYIGPNGAGKSTTIKMLTGILVPTSGTVLVAGRIPHQERQEHVRRIGVVFGQKTQLWWDVPVSESLRLLKEIYKIPDATYRRNMEMFNELLDLYEFLETPVRQLSLGQRMRSDLAASLLHDPDILFLDEPTIGVDVVAKERFRTFMHTLNRERQVTVLLTTHDMADIEKICPRMLIIDKGNIIYDGDVSTMKEQFTPYRTLVVDVAEGVTAVALPHAQLIQQQGQRFAFRFDKRVQAASTLIAHLAEQYPITDVSIEKPDIETVVREFYQQA